MGVIPWSPLARGLLAGKRSRHAAGESKRAQSDDLAAYYYHRDQDWDIVERVVEVAGRLGVVPAQVAIAWLLHKPGITSPIVGATKIEHLEDAVKALGVSLSPQDIADIAAYLSALPVPAALGIGPGARLAQGEVLYRRDCASCHGDRGQGERHNADKDRFATDFHDDCFLSTSAWYSAIFAAAGRRIFYLVIPRNAAS